MKILILSWRDIKNPKSGGAERLTHECAKRWVKQGSSVEILSANFFKGSSFEQVDNVSIRRIGKEWMVPLLLFHLIVFLDYKKHYQGKVDIVIDQIHGIPFLTPLYVREKKLAFIMEVAKNIWFSMFPLPVAFFGYFVEKIFLRFYKNTRFATISSSTKKDLIDIGISRELISIIPVGANIHELLPVLHGIDKEDDLTIIFVNRLVKMKGIEDAIRALKVINNKIPNAKLWIVGSGNKNYEDKLKALASRLGLLEKIIFFGFVEELEKYKLMAKAHVLIHPSVREGWGIVVIEAAALGTPSVGYNVPGLRDSIVNNKTGLLCDENSPYDMGNKIIKIIKDKDKYKNLKKEAILWSKNFTWEKSSENLWNVISDI